MLCIVSLYIVCSSPFFKVIIFCEFSTLTISGNGTYPRLKKRVLSKFIAMWCFVSQIFLLKRSGRCRQAFIFILCFIWFCFKAITVALMDKLERSAICWHGAKMLWPLDFSFSHWIYWKHYISFLTNFAFCSLKLLQCVQQKYLKNGCNKYGEKDERCVFDFFISLETRRVVVCSYSQQFTLRSQFLFNSIQI